MNRQRAQASEGYTAAAEIVVAEQKPIRLEKGDVIFLGLGLFPGFILCRSGLMR